MLGPLLFVLFINDLPKVTKHEVRCFCMLMTLRCSGGHKDTEDCDNCEDLDELRKWTKKWPLSFHPEKSKYMRIGNTMLEDKGHAMYNDIKTRRKRYLGSHR